MVRVLNEIKPKKLNTDRTLKVCKVVFKPFYFGRSVTFIIKKGPVLESW